MNESSLKDLADVNEDLLNESLQSYLLQGADQIRKSLGRSDRSFEFMSRAFNARGRKHFIYEALNEIEQLVMVLMDTNDSLKEAPQMPTDEIGKRIYRNSLAVAHREGAVHSRRLNELLVELINFSTTNEDTYYDHYFLYQELDQRKKKKRDHKTYYGCENLNNKNVISAIKQYIVFGEEKLDLERCWYLSGKTPKLGGSAQLATFENSFKHALQHATTAERIALKFSYSQGYAESSQSIHLGIGRIPPTISFEGLRAAARLLFNVAMLCLIRCNKLLGSRKRSGIVPDFARTYRQQQKLWRDLYKSYVNPNVKKGDFVVSGDSLFEVLGVAQGEFGYRSFKLRYLTRPHIPEVPVEWYTASSVRKLEDGTRMRDSVLDMLTIDGKKPILDSRIVRRVMRETVTKFWNEYIDALRIRPTPGS